MKFIKVKIKDIGEIVGGATPSTKEKENYDGDIPWITPKDLTGYKGIFIGRGERNITQKGYNSCSTKIIPRNSILFSSRAPIGYLAITKNKLCTNQGFKSIIPNEKVNYLFLYYLLKYNTSYITNLGTGTTFKEISGTVMENIELNVPELLYDQERIAYILYKLDEKIRLNNQINDNLYKILEQYIDEHYYNNEFVQNGNVSDIGKIQSGYAFKSKDLLDKTTNNKILKIKNIDVSGVDIDNTQYVYDEVADKVDKKFLIIRGNVIIAMTGAELGKTGYLYGRDYRYFLNQRVGVIRGNDKYSELYLNCLFLLKNMQDTLNSKGYGSAQPNISTSDIENIEIPIPKVDELETFYEKCNPIYSKMILNSEQNQSLTQLRDVLLPKLMNGEIDLDKIEI